MAGDSPGPGRHQPLRHFGGGRAAKRQRIRSRVSAVDSSAEGRRAHRSGNFRNRPSDRDADGPVFAHPDSISDALRRGPDAKAHSHNAAAGHASTFAKCGGFGARCFETATHQHANAFFRTHRDAVRHAVNLPESLVDADRHADA
jgi:hypothetical protein